MNAPHRGPKPKVRCELCGGRYIDYGSHMPDPRHLIAVRRAAKIKYRNV